MPDFIRPAGIGPTFDGNTGQRNISFDICIISLYMTRELVFAKRGCRNAAGDDPGALPGHRENRAELRIISF
jgi:hypothetical protein